MNATPVMSMSFFAILAMFGMLALLVMVPILLIGAFSSKRKNRRD